MQGFRNCFHFFNQSKPRLHGSALFESAAGFNFNPLSTSAMRLLPTAIYCGQIERFQGASGFALAPGAPGRLLTPLLRLLTQTDPPIWVRRVIVTKSSGKKAGWGRMGGGFPKPRGRMAVVPLADPQASPLEADRLTSVRA